jgi:hypothetical protein
MKIIQYAALALLPCLFACQMAAVRVPLSGEVSLANVPDDFHRQGDDLKDYNDQPFAPTAWHGAQIFEWLGPGVSEEKAPNADDTFDDGMVVVNPSSFRAGRTVVLAVNVRSSYANFPQSFLKVFTAILAVWIDWNYNSSFAAAEEAMRVEDTIPFESGGEQFSQALYLLPVQVPKTFVPRQVTDTSGSPIGIRPPPIRLRLDYQLMRRPLGPGGEASYGEVEDHDISPNDLAYFMDNPKDEGITGLSAAMVGYSRALAGSRLLVAKYSPQAKTRTLTPFAVTPLAGLLEILAVARAEVLREPADSQR